MKKSMLMGLSAALMLTLGSMTVSAEETAAIQTQDGLLTISLPGEGWYQVVSEENTEMFSDGDCAILVNLYKNGDTLPVIQSADANHEMIYTAAASTQSYVLHVVGYAHEQSDFSSICKSINTINVDSAKITDQMLNHTISTDEYKILEVNYEAWVSADGLNVRSTSATDGEIIASLEYGDKVTVTGSVAHNGTEIGWARIKTAEGKEGYVSAQFLTTTKIVTGSEAPKQDSGSATTGKTITLYGASGTAYTLYETADGNWKTEKGTIFWRTTGDNYVCSSGDVLYVTAPSNNNIYRTGSCVTLYTDIGCPTYVYEYSDGNWYDDNWDRWYYYDSGSWMNANTGHGLYSYDPTASSGGDSSSSNEEACLIRSEDGSDEFLITYIGDGIWVDSNNVYYYRYNSYGTFISDNNVLYYDSSAYQR